MTYRLKINDTQVFQAMTNYLWSIRAIKENEEVVNVTHPNGYDFNLTIKEISYD